MPATPDQVREVLTNYVKAWKTNDKALLLSLFAEDAKFHDPVGAPVFEGHKGIGGLWDYAHRDPAIVNDPEIEEIRACANEGILRFKMRVRNPKANQGLDLSVVEHFILNDAGKIQAGYAFWDHSHVSVPAGMEPIMADMAEAH